MQSQIAVSNCNVRSGASVVMNHRPTYTLQGQNWAKVKKFSPRQNYSLSKCVIHYDWQKFRAERFTRITSQRERKRSKCAKVKYGDTLLTGHSGCFIEALKGGEIFLPLFSLIP